ncbi:MAG: DUF3159 domain-containing protein [archaeon]
MSKSKLIKEIYEELRTVISKNTFDAILPPTIYVIVNNMYDLVMAALSALIIALFLVLYRFKKKQKWYYAVGGFFGVMIASSFAYFANQAKNYFLTDAISSGFILLLIIISLFINKPLAAWLSHITRGWELKWFWRKDIKPAYFEVTMIWGLFFSLRLLLQIYLFIRGNVLELFWSRVLLGFPSIIILLIVTYIYGIWRLNKLGGPGIEEFRSGKKPPWDGQNRGF